MTAEDKFIFNSVVECPHCGYIRTTEKTKEDVGFYFCSDCWLETDTETFTYTCTKCKKEFNCDIKIKSVTTHFITVGNITKKKENK
ncbi:hypothetical protein [Campylobacter ureolyticus]|uniref:Uncharacterized protein n=1 Tax=Campylobacter ureolyticus TaxID=827 RepID=A0A9Q4KQN8_9BACT|nr:hypothetical protein [Campylobacter ureolyticus]MCZ6102894.1 hypothetical protein [Campylobacter ureolyticus]MCZ6161961.1 hypothetical protein [Campylobacter ureolyticus]MCZ6170963.1 hypothetical protein [Campylobacter ureolyticus]MDU4981092.1 hypothetical protein [Campylobacter ureolyticus]